MMWFFKIEENFLAKELTRRNLDEAGHEEYPVETSPWTSLGAMFWEVEVRYKVETLEYGFERGVVL